MPAARSACRCWETFALDWPLSRASSSPLRGACASRSSSSSRTGLAKALPISAIASKRPSFVSWEPMRCYSIDRLIACQAPTTTGDDVFFRQLLNDDTACASYLFGCTTRGQFAVVDPHVELVDEYVRLGNTEIEALATPGHALVHHAYLVTDHRRADEPWLVLTGDALLVGDAGRPDLHAHGEHAVEEMARMLYHSLTDKLLALPDHLLLYPGHYSGSVCGRGLSGNPASTVGFERRFNEALRHDSEEEFVEALLKDIPPTP